ncbi:ATP-binding protein [Bradyrhizobium sp. I1.7.5]|uniref:ATP-binding protein n=1 Tax=Bradyrhizobium sp. I1.7.5 TaxID=3156363 RepID=UPI003399AD3A
MTAHTDQRLREKTDEVLARAALVGVFDPLELLELAQSGGMGERILDKIVDHVQEVVFEDRMYWKLTARARHDALERAIARTDFETLLQEAKPHPSERFAHYLIALLRENEDYEEFLENQQLSRSELQDLASAQDFVNRARKKPSPTGKSDPRWKLARMDDEQRLRHVAPKLVGRTHELGLLTAYAANGNVESSIELDSIIADPKKLDWLRPLLLTGIGGSGKSALVAELVRTVRKDDWSGPITVLLDYDRPNLALGAEKDWTAELTRQIGRARTELDGEMDELRRDALRVAAETSSDLKSADILLERLGDILGRQAVRHDLLLVVDTFEELIVSSEMGLADEELEREPFGLVLSWIDRLMDLQTEDGSQAFKTVRAIVAGRIQPFVSEPRRLPAWFCGHLELGPFSPQETGDFLRVRDTENKFNKQWIELISESKIRWYPLFLIVLIKFAAQKSSQELDEIARDVGGATLYGTVEAMRVLYSRFLDRIKDHIVSRGPNDRRTIPKEQICQLAHPGLALKTVTAELIRDVLAGPCGLGNIDIERAKDLLRALSKEAWLVDSYGPNEVRHVTNLRRLMLPMLCGTTRTPDGEPSDLHIRVRFVQQRAAEWYEEPSRVQEPESPAMAAYYRAFYGDVSAIAVDEALARRVLHIGRDDIHAMPPAARAILLKDEQSLTSEERAALPEPQKRDVEVRNLKKRSKAGVIRASQPPSASAPQRTDTYGVPAEVPGPPSSPSIRRQATLEEIFDDADLAARVDVAFKSADFLEATRLAAPSMESLSRQMIGRLPSSMFQRLTNHWTWKWACAHLALGSGRTVVEQWQLRDLDIRPGWVDYVPLIAIARIAACDVSLFQSRRNRPWMTSGDMLDLDGMRMIALDLVAFDIDPVLPMSLSQAFSDEGWSSAERGSGPFEFSEEARVQMLLLQKSDVHRYLALSEMYNSNQPVRPHPEILENSQLRAFVRGRTPELYDPIRAALIDVVRYAPGHLGDVLERFSRERRIWPADMRPERLLSELQKARQADFLLLRLIEFVDVCGLLKSFVTCFHGLALERVRVMSQLMEKYDSLLLTGKQPKPSKNARVRGRR